jgi:FKBP-type peptidyl-prolyl cis-trans isomerase
MDAIVHASKGDSITVLIPVDSLTDFQTVPGLVEKGQDIKLVIKVVDLMSKAQYEEHLKNAESEQKVKDSKIIEDYLKSKNIKASKTASGLYYVIDKKGAGPNAQKGQTVSVAYTGTLLNGKQFDSSRKPGGQPYTFKLGQDPVIAGWQEGIALLNKGAKARLFIPSYMGYGVQGAGGDIPPNAVLIFDVELVDIK